MTRHFASHFGTYEVEDDAAGRPRLAPFRHDPAPSPLGHGFLELAEHDVRIRQPMARAGWLAAPGRAGGKGRGREPFVPISWDEAARLAAGEIDRVRHAHGNQAIFAGSYGWASAGRFHHAQSQLKRFLNLAGGFVSAVNTYSFGAGAVILPHVLGPAHQFATDTAPRWDDIAEKTDLMLAFGGFRATNSQVEAGGTGRHTVLDWLGRATGRGLDLVVLSPSRRDVPPGIAARHLFIKPNTDTAVLLAMAQVVVAEGLADRAFLARCTAGWPELERYLTGAADGAAKTPDWAEAISGLPASTIRALARGFARRHSLVALSWSLQRARHGEQPYWAAIALAAIAGHAGKPGAGFAFGLGSVNSVGQPVRRLAGAGLDQGRNPVTTFIPVARIADLLLEPGRTIDYDGQKLTFPDIRLVYWAGGNPFHHHQDLNRLRRAFARPDTIIVHEPFWTATARHADLVLPTALPTERDDIAGASRDNWLVASRKLAEPPGEARTDHAILAALAERLGFAEAFTEGRSEMEWLAHLYDGYRARHQDMPPFEEFWEIGFWRLEGGPDESSAQSRLERFVRDPEAAPLDTPSGRIELASARIASFGYDDCPGHPAWLAPEEWLGAPLAARFPIHLLSPQPEGRLHSQLDAAAASRAGKRRGRETLLMNDEDASRRGIGTDDVVRVFNDRGACLAAALPTGDVMPGAAILPTGAWYDPADPADPMTLEKHGNPNAVTPDIGTSRLAQGPAANSCLVEIERWEAEPPEVTAFRAPATVGGGRSFSHREKVAAKRPDEGWNAGGRE